MSIEAGQVWRGAVSGREILILKTDEDAVQYRDLKYGTVFAVSRKAFERYDVYMIQVAP